MLGETTRLRARLQQRNVSSTSWCHRGWQDGHGSLGSIHAKVAVIDHKRLFVGSMNLDDRSERRNTELGIIIDSPELSEEFIHMMDFDSSVYRLRLSADGRGIEWLKGGSRVDGPVLTDDPETSAWLRFKVWLLSPLVPESEL